MVGIKKTSTENRTIFELSCFNLNHPFTCIIAGPTGCGKTIFVSKLLQHANTMIEPAPQRIMYFYSIWQDAFDKILQLNPLVEFRTDKISIDEIDSNKTNLVILDDLMNESKDDVSVSNLFTKGSHHKNLSVIFLSQNLFIQGKETRSISLNSHYMVIFKNPRDRSQFSFLARQMYPNNSKFLEEAYADATSKPHGYLFIDLKQSTHDSFRIRANIFPLESMSVYVDINNYNTDNFLSQKIFFI